MSVRGSRGLLWLLAAAVLVVGVAAGEGRAAGTVLFGDQKIESGNDSDAAGMAEAFKTTAGASGTLASLSVYVSSGSAATNVIAGLYASNVAGTHPAALLAQGTLGGPVKGAWNTVVLTSQPQVTAGSVYWITILSPGGAGTVAFRDVLGGGVSETSAQTTLTALPAVWSSGNAYRDGPISAYGSAPLVPDTSAPTAPGGLAVSQQAATSFVLGWSASSDNVGVAGYDLYLGAAKVATTTGTSFTFTGLNCATAYVAAVDAFDSAGNVSPQSTTNAATAACPDTTPPTKPTGLTESGSTATSISFAWNPSSDDVGVTGYGLYLNGVLQATATSTSGTLGGLVCGTSYTVGVDASDAAGNHSNQAATTMTTAVCPPDSQAPTTPTGLTLTARTPTSLTLSWTPSTDDVGVAGYGLFLDGVSQNTTGATSALFAGLLCGTSHTLGVNAFDAAGNASATATLAVQTAACPDTTPPTVTLTAPHDGANLAGTVQITASASDDVGVVGVQFKVDGANLGPEQTTGPYTFAWNTTGAANGTHTLTAVARDAAGNSTTSAAVTITVANPLTQPTPIPAADTNGITVGPGFVNSGDHQLVRTAAGVVYVIAADDDPCQIGGSGVIRVWKGIGAQNANSAVPTSFVEMDVAHHPVSGGSNICQYDGGSNSVLFNPDSRLDSSGTIQMVYIDMFNRNLYYQTFSTVNDTWGPRTLIATFASKTSGFSWPRGSEVALTLDKNDVPHVAYATYGTSNQINYTDRVGGSWSTPITIFSGTNELCPSITTALDNSIHLTWVDNADATHPVIKYAHYTNGSWSGVETVSSGDTNVLSHSNGDQQPSVATDTSGRPFVGYLDGTVNGSDDYVRLRYRTGNGTWTDDSPPGTAGGTPSATGTLFAHSPQIYITPGNDTFVFLGHDALISPGGFAHQPNGPTGTWSAYTPIDPRNKNNTTAGYAGLDGSASTRYDPLRDNNPNIIDLLYYDENDGTPGYPHHATLYYKAIALH